MCSRKTNRIEKKDLCLLILTHCLIQLNGKNHKYFDLLFKKRNLTVHTYNQNVAEEVYQAALIFPLAVKTLIIKLSVKP